MDGASLSSTVTLKMHIAVFPDRSIAVAVTEVYPTAKTLPLLGVEMTDSPGQLSVDVGSSNVATARQEPRRVSTAILGGQAIAGLLVSLTVTSNVHIAELPAKSDATAFTGVVPTPKTDPLLGLVLPDVGQSSKTVGLKVTTASQTPGLVFTVKVGGQVILGGVVSNRVIYWKKWLRT